MTRQQNAKTMRAILLGAGGGLAAAIPFAGAFPKLQIACAALGPLLLAVGGSVAAGEFNEPAKTGSAPPPAAGFARTWLLVGLGVVAALVVLALVWPVLWAWYGGAVLGAAGTLGYNHWRSIRWG